ncbi:MAG: alpha/beta hydrolase [Phenylobacterium sp.]|nr:MAG: alpha/beta hydrolase [Phenylobacterium sp.]
MKREMCRPGILRRSIRRCAMVLALALIPAVVAISAAAAPARAVAVTERWKLGGIDQAVVVRGDDRANPLLVWVGDLWCETPALRKYQAQLEHDFTVIYWCQRYSGASFDPFAARPARLSFDDYVSDLGELTDRARKRFQKSKIVIVAHSSGTIIGLRYAAAHPEAVSAYVGVGQVIDAPESLRRDYTWALATARARRDGSAVAELIALGPPPYKDNHGARVLRGRVVTYGGAFHNGLSYGRLATQSALSGYANWRDLAAAALADGYTAPMAPEMAAARFNGRGAKYSTPIFLASGRFDRRADPALAEDFVKQIEAPAKGFEMFELSAHSPPFEQPAAFRNWLVREIRPIAAHDPAGG